MLEYEVINNKSVRVMGFKSNKSVKNLIIPSEIEGKMVKVIAREAFLNAGIESVVLPNALEEIGSKSFARNNLKELELPEKLVKMEYSCFEENNIEKIVIPNGVAFIPQGAFARNSLKEIHLPKRLIGIQANSFSDNQLTNIVLPDRVKSLSITAFRDNYIEDISFPSSADKVSNYAFHGNPLKNISIGNYALLEMLSAYKLRLKKVYIKDTVLPDNKEWVVRRIEELIQWGIEVSTNDKKLLNIVNGIEEIESEELFWEIVDFQTKF